MATTYIGTSKTKRGAERMKRNYNNIPSSFLGKAFIRKTRKGYEVRSN